MIAKDIIWHENFGVRFFPYQLGFGISISWWPCFRFQIYLGPIRIWIATNETNRN